MSLSFSRVAEKLRARMPLLVPGEAQSGLISARFWGRLCSRIHAAAARVFTSANCSVCAPEYFRGQAEAVDTGFMARPDLLRRDAAVTRARICSGPGQVESAGYLSIRRRVRRHGSSPAGNDPRVRRSRVVRTLQMAVHFRAALSTRNLCRVLLVGLKRNFAGCLLLGCLARIDADLRLLPDLRRKNGNVRYPHAPARFRHVPDLVCHRGGAFAVSVERHPGHLLHVWWAIYSAVGYNARPEHDSGRSHFCLRFVRRAFYSDLDRGEPPESCKTRVAGHQHRILVVLQ